MSQVLASQVLECADTLRTTSTDWEKRSAALNTLQHLVKTKPVELFTTEVLRPLSECFPVQIRDLRSSVARSTCRTIVVFSQILGDNFRIVGDSLFPTILELGGAANKIILSYVVECANILLHHTHFRRSIGFIADTIQSAKHGTAREYAYMYLLTILCSYPLHALERQMDTIEGLIIDGMGDATAASRKRARTCFSAVQECFPDVADGIRARSDPRTQKLLDNLPPFEPPVLETKLLLDSESTPSPHSPPRRVPVASPAKTRGGHKAAASPARPPQALNSGRSADGRLNGAHTWKPAEPAELHEPVASSASAHSVDGDASGASSPTSTDLRSSSRRAERRPTVSLGAGGPWVPAVGDRVRVHSRQDMQPPSTGTVKFFGTTEFSTGHWVGVALDEPRGRHAGFVDGQQYFHCRQDHGVFVRVAALSKLSPDSDDGEPEYSSTEDDEESDVDAEAGMEEDDDVPALQAKPPVGDMTEMRMRHRLERLSSGAGLRAAWLDDAPGAGEAGTGEISAGAAAEIRRGTPAGSRFGDGYGGLSPDEFEDLRDAANDVAGLMASMNMVHSDGDGSGGQRLATPRATDHPTEADDRSGSDDDSMSDGAEAVNDPAVVKPGSDGAPSRVPSSVALEDKQSDSAMGSVASSTSPRETQEVTTKAPPAFSAALDSESRSEEVHAPAADTTETVSDSDSGVDVDDEAEAEAEAEAEEAQEEGVARGAERAHTPEAAQQNGRPPAGAAKAHADASGQQSRRLKSRASIEIRRRESEVGADGTDSEDEPTSRDPRRSSGGNGAGRTLSPVSRKAAVEELVALHRTHIDEALDLLNEEMSGTADVADHESGVSIAPQHVRRWLKQTRTHLQARAEGIQAMLEHIRTLEMQLPPE